MKKFVYGVLTVAITGVLIGCPDKGPLEKAGERTDEVIDNIKDGDPILERKGPLEKAGEKVDQAVNEVTE